MGSYQRFKKNRISIIFHKYACFLKSLPASLYERAGKNSPCIKGGKAADPDGPLARRGGFLQGIIVKPSLRNMSPYLRICALRKRNNEYGFTLIEVLFAVAVLAFGLLAVSSLQGSATRGNLMAFNRTEALTLAQTQMETLMALPYASVASGGPTVQGNYTITWNVIPGNPIPNCKLVTVTVGYSEKGIARRPVVLTCVKPNVTM